MVLITGASSGVGQSTARLLSQRGYQVFGTSRNPAVSEPISGVEMLPLDVRGDESARACLEAGTQRAGRLGILVNNAGYELAGALEEISVDEVRVQADIAGEVAAALGVVLGDSVRQALVARPTPTLR